MSDEPTKTRKASLRFTDARQERIHRRLLLVGPGPASFFRDACRIITGDFQLEATSHVVAHLVREIESALRDVIESVSQPTGGSPGSNHEPEVRAALAVLGIPEDDPIAKMWLGLTNKGSQRALAPRAHRAGLGRARGADAEFHDWWGEIQTLLDGVLERFESRYLSWLAVLDELLTVQAPASRDLRKLRNHVPDNLVTQSYFFDQLQSHRWLGPLAEEGFFDYPPPVERDTDDGTLRFPPWPICRYLARMAKIAEVQAEVLSIALRIPATENAHVDEDLTDLALNLPASMAARLAPRIEEFARSPRAWRPRNIGKLIGHLAKGSEPGPALRLAKALLEIVPGREVTDPDGERLPTDPQPRIQIYDYEEILKTEIPELVKAGGQQAFDFPCDRLEEAVRIPRREDAAPEDYSYIWRPAVEASDQNHRFGLKDALVDTVRDAAEALASPSIREVISSLESRPWRIFHRIALHLLRLFADEVPDLVVSALTDRIRFDETGLRHEYFLLARERFRHLKEGDQQIVLGWIDRGLDLAEVKESWHRNTGETPSEEALNQHQMAWQRDHLAAIEDSLPPSWKERYEKIVREVGPPKHAEFASYSESWSGPTSPKSGDELAAMSLEDLIDYLAAWEPSSDPWGPSREGLGRILWDMIAKEPDRFARAAENFTRIDPTFVHALFHGWREAVSQGRGFSWGPVVALSRWVMAQDREIPARRSDHPELDTGWGWTRKAIAALLSVGFEKGGAEIPIGLRAEVWPAVEALTRDPEPDPAHEARYGGSNMDPAELAINTVRGEAMHALVKYGLWVRRHLEAEPDAQERLARGFGEMPEVRTTLQTHLDVGGDPSLAIRSVYGQWFPWLVLLDPEWSAGAVSRIFSTLPGEERFRDSAWETYVVFCRPYDNVVPVLRTEYVRAIESLGVHSAERRHAGDPDEHLAAHLMILFWRGRLSASEPGSLLEQFFEKAPPKIRRYAIEFIGRSLRDDPTPLPEEVVRRLQELWARRLDAARSSPRTDDALEEIVPFGWWFASAKLDEEWAVQQLEAVLKLADRVDPDFLVVERLVEIVDRRPRASIDLLDLLLEGQRKRRGAFGLYRQEDIREILRKALHGADLQAREAAEALINRLVASGELEYRELLRRNGDQGK